MIAETIADKIVDKIAIPGTTLEVFPICFGTCDIGSKIDERTSFDLLDRYHERGGNFLDSAAVYANWLPIENSISEKTVGKWMKARGNRQALIVATKGAHPDLATMHIPRMSRREIESDLHDSLRHLQTDTIDLYWLHRDDVSRPVGDILEVLNEQVQVGKIRHFGCSNWTLARMQLAQAYANERGLQGFVANQMLWSLATVEVEAIADKSTVVMDETMRDYHQSSGLAAIPYSSQAQGLFYKMEHGTPPGGVGGDARYDSSTNVGRYWRLHRLATELLLQPTQVILGYLISQPFTTIPIVGCQNRTQLDDSLKAAGIHLASEYVTFLETGVWPN
ncbi:MAG: aldo/keto reductase [Chloroflexi bacterium]|nr:aldo/keto reductase [Chloroflexota bacterium]